MNFIIKIFLFLIIISLQVSCSNNEKKVSVLKNDNLETQMLNLFEEAYIALEERDTIFSAKKFNEAELIFPQSEWAPIAALMTAYVYYSDDYYSDAIYHLERYLTVYPKHKDKSYAHYLLAMCYYENIIDEKRALDPLIKARKEFEFIVDNYPNSEFSIDAKFKLELIEDRMAGKEMYIARHYAKSKKWIPAINRFKFVLENYETSIYIEEALHRLVELHYKIGLENEARKYANLLGYNYASSKWYEATYKIYNDDYEFDEKKFFKEKKKNKKTMFSKFKTRFKKLFD